MREIPARAIAVVATAAIVLAGLGACASTQGGSDATTKPPEGETTDLVAPTSASPDPDTPIDDPSHSLDWIPEGGLAAPMCPGTPMGDVPQGQQADHCIDLAQAKLLPSDSLDEKFDFLPGHWVDTEYDKFVDSGTITKDGELFYREIGEDGDLTGGEVDSWRYGLLSEDGLRRFPDPAGVVSGRDEVPYSVAVGDGMWAWAQGPATDGPMAPGDAWELIAGNTKSTRVIMSSKENRVEGELGPAPGTLAIAGDWVYWTLYTNEMSLGDDGSLDLRDGDLWAAPLDGSQEPHVVAENTFSLWMSGNADGYCYVAVVEDGVFTIKRLESTAEAQTVVAPTPLPQGFELAGVVASDDKLAWTIQEIDSTAKPIVTFVDLASGATAVVTSSTSVFTGGGGDVSCSTAICVIANFRNDGDATETYLVNLDNENVWRMGETDTASSALVNGSWMVWLTGELDAAEYPVTRAHVGQLDSGKL